MKSLILERTNTVIIRGIKNPTDVFYILGQSRRYLEIIHGKQEKLIKYPTLSLFADWILHSKLNGEPAKAKLLDYEKFFDQVKEDASFKFMTSGFTLFVDLKNDFRKFCKENAISTRFLNKHQWKRFITFLVEELREVPLLNEKTGSTFQFKEGFIVVNRPAISFEFKKKDNISYSFSIDIKILSR